MEKAVLFDPGNSDKTGLEEINVISWTRIDGFYIKTDRGLVAKAYVYPLKYQERLQELFDEYRDAKAIFDRITARIFYKDIQEFI